MSRLDAAYRVTERLWWGLDARGIVLLIAVLMVVRLWAATHVGLLFDEPYYWLWAQHLQAGYFDHPPMVALWIRLGTLIAGNSVLGIRIMFLINMVVATAVGYALGRVLFGRRTAEHVALWTNVTPLFSIAGIIATPDGPSVFFWTLTLLAYAMVVKTERGAWWIAVGVAAGLGLVSKYTNLLLGAGIVLSLAVDPRLRRWFLSPWLWLGGLVALAIFAPVIWWNHTHDWVSFRFQFGRAGENAFKLKDLLTLIFAQPLIFNPLAAVFAGIAAWRVLKRTGPRSQELTLLFATSVPAFLFIFFQATHGEVLQHWLAPAFPALTVAAVAVAETIGEDQKILRRIRTDVVPLSLAAMVVVYAYATTPANRYFPGRDPVESTRGWPEFANEVEALRQQTGAAWIATNQYPLTGELSYELRDRAVVIPVTERMRYTFAPPPAAGVLQGPALLVVDTGTDMRPFRACFATLTKVGEIDRTGWGRLIESVAAYRAEGVKAGVLAEGCDGP
jgi:4-amino-4-deoxy-L-arabinose transferase-like glycosyltransferase